MSHDIVAIERVATAEQVERVRVLLREYRDAVGGHLCFESYEQELRALPGDYAPPTGALFLARIDGADAGCVALRSLAAHVGEMKRLYVRPPARGRALGRALVERVVAESRSLGHRKLRLDTLPAMHAAQALYVALGFREIEAYHPAPDEGVRFFELAW